METIQNYGVMLREAILKENIDGEALQFAQKRLGSRKTDISILTVVSDGAPVDDSTLSVNGGTYLERHLRTVVEELSSENLNLMAVGIDTDASRYYGNRSIKSKAERLGVSLIALFRRRLQVTPSRKPRRDSAK